MPSESGPSPGKGDEGTPDRWQIWVDTGGTFTDCLAVTPAGQILRTKVLSNARIRATTAAASSSHGVGLDLDWHLPEDFFQGARLKPLAHDQKGWEITGYRAEQRTIMLGSAAAPGIRPGQPVEIVSDLEAPVLAAHIITRTPLLATLPPNSMRLATTRGTNALLERRGSPTVLFITRGFRDLLTIGNQQRPDLFALNVSKTAPLYASVVEVEERLKSSGEVLSPLALDDLRPAAMQALEAGTTAAAIALLHSYRNPLHEDRLAEYLLDLGFHHVSRSSQLAPLIKIVPRAETAVVNAYLSGVIGDYLKTVEKSIRPGPLHLMTSAGSLVRAARFQPKDSLLSGPAGGVVGAAAMASQSGWPRSLAFDMGGTSTDVSRFDGILDYRFETHVGDARLLSPSLAIETVAAGGGSICHFDGRQLKVGPHSAGADPGPACYGAGGPMTLTDVNLLLGRLRPESFQIPIDAAAAAHSAADLMTEMGEDSAGADDLDQILQGLLDIANERMAEAVRRISIRQGYRPADFALVAFGGAGGQHACALAEILDMSTVLVPEDAGLLSAVGLGRARVERIIERQILEPLSEVQDRLTDLFTALAREAESAVRGEGVRQEKIDIGRYLAYLRLAGQEATIGVVFEEPDSLAGSFAAAYHDHYGYRPEGAPIEVESLRVMASSSETPVAAPEASDGYRSIDSKNRQSVYLNRSRLQVPVFERPSLLSGDRFAGPALVFERHCATMVGEDWTGEIDGHGCLILRRLQSAGARD